MSLRKSPPILVAFTVTLLAAGAWALAARPVDGLILARAKAALERMGASFVDSWGLSVSYEGASPSLADGLVLKNVDIATGHGSYVRIARVRARYDLFALLGRPSDFGLSGIRVEGIDAFLNLDADGDLLSRLLKAFSEGAPSGEAGSPAFDVEVRGSVLRVASSSMPELTLNVRRARLDSGSADGMGFSLTGSLAFADPEARWFASAMTAPLSVSGRASADGTSLTLTGRFAAEGDLGRLSQTEATVSLERGVVSVSLAATRSIDRFELRYDTASSRASLDASFRDFLPLRLFRPSGRLAFLQAWLSYPLSGRVAVSSDLSAEGTVGSVSLSGTLPAAFVGADTGFFVDARGSWNRLDVMSARVSGPAFKADFSGTVEPGRLGASGILDLSCRLGSGIDAAASMELFGSGGSWFALAPRADLGGSELNDLTVSIEADGSAMAFYLDAALPEDALSAERPRLELEGSLAFGDRPYLAASARIDPTRLSTWSPVLEKSMGSAMARALGPFMVGGSVSLYTDFKELSYSSGDTLLVYEPASSAFALVSFYGDAGSFTLQELKASIGAYALTGSASVDFSSPAGVSFQGKLALDDVPYAVSGQMADDGLFITGDYGLEMSARSLDGITSAAFWVKELPVPIAGGVSFLSCEANGRFASADEWSIALADLTLDNPDPDARLPDLSLSGYFDQDGGKAGRLSLADATSALDGYLDVAWNLRASPSVSIEGSVSGPDGEGYTISARYGGSGSSLSLSLSKAPLARLALPGLEGSLDAELSAEDLFGDPRARFSFTLNGGKRSDQLPFASGRGTYGSGVLSLSDCRVRYLGQSLDGLSASFDTRRGDLSLKAQAALALGLESMTMNLSAAGSSAAAEGQGLFSDYSVKGTAAGFRWNGGAPSDWPFDLRIAQSAVSASIGSAGEATFSLSGLGDLRLSLSRAFPLSLVAEGRISEGSASIDVRDIVFELGSLFPFIGVEEVNAASGQATGSLRIRGKLSDPEVEGTLDLSDVYLEVPGYVSKPIGPLDEPVFFTGNTMESNQTDMKCGEATVSASLVAELRGGIPENIRIAVRTEGKGLIPVATKLLGLDIAGLASAELAIEINDQNFSLTGAIDMPEGDVVLTAGLLGGSGAGQAGEDGYGVSVALGVGFGKGVRVYFPDKRVPLFYGQADPSSRISLAYNGSTGDFSLKGRAQLRGGNVFYIQRSFYLKSATIDFNENADSFDPILSVDAESRTRNADGPVLVLLKANAVRLSGLSFRLSSVPGMSETEIARLLGQELLGMDERGNPDLGRAIIENSDLLPQLNVVSVFERNVQDLLGLDVFFVRTQVLQRWLYDLSGLAGEGEAATLGDYLDNTAITAGKYLGDGLYLQALLRLQEVPLASAGNLRLDSQISLEWVTPHFMLSWSFQPEHPDTLFVTDQTFSLFWSIPLK